MKLASQSPMNSLSRSEAFVRPILLGVGIREMLILLTFQVLKLLGQPTERAPSLVVHGRFYFPVGIGIPHRVMI
jgi:hypothetical protein